MAKIQYPICHNKETCMWYKSQLQAMQMHQAMSLPSVFSHANAAYSFMSISFNLSVDIVLTSQSKCQRSKKFQSYIWHFYLQKVRQYLDLFSSETFIYLFTHCFDTVYGIPLKSLVCHDPQRYFWKLHLSYVLGSFQAKEHSSHLESQTKARLQWYLVIYC